MFNTTLNFLKTLEQFKENLAAQTPEKVLTTVPGISNSKTGYPESVAETPDANSFYGV